MQGPREKVTGGIAVPTVSNWDQVPGTKWEGDQVPWYQFQQKAKV